MLKFIIVFFFALIWILNEDSTEKKMYFYQNNHYIFFLIFAKRNIFKFISRLLSLLFLLLLILMRLNHEIKCIIRSILFSFVAQNKGNDTRSIVWRDLFHLFCFVSFYSFVFFFLLKLNRKREVYRVCVWHKAICVAKQARKIFLIVVKWSYNRKKKYPNVEIVITKLMRRF